MTLLILLSLNDSSACVHISVLYQKEREKGRGRGRGGGVTSQWSKSNICMYFGRAKFIMYMYTRVHNVHHYNYQNVQHEGTGDAMTHSRRVTFRISKGVSNILETSNPTLP